ncbi:MAG: DUF433 domain-containing protein [Chloroflexi bacterium]|nr:MAG: DUF433 domain-containing protein [Chloroflexota bacterium]
MVREIAPRITADPRIKGGKPVIEGTRIPVDFILGQLGGAMTIGQVTDEYDLRREDIYAALRYAAHLVSAEESNAID